MTKRGSRTLVWNHENHLSQSKTSSGAIEEEYLYDDGGQCIKKRNTTSAVYYPNAFYEVETGNGSVVASQAEDAVEISGPVADASDAIYLPLVSAQGGTVAKLQSEDAKRRCLGRQPRHQCGKILLPFGSLRTSFGGQRVAMSAGGTWSYLHSDRCALCVGGCDLSNGSVE